MQLATLLAAAGSLVVALIALFLNNGEVKLAKRRSLIMDTSGLIDGRIKDIVDNGFAPSRIIIPQFVLSELQMLADGADSQKRERARYGFDVVRYLQGHKNTEVVIDRTDFSSISEVDDKLIQLAKKRGSSLYTTDFNLNKLATVEGLVVLNVNELANSLRLVALPGEKSKVKIIQKGSNHNQGVGYMDDGTMVVVERANNLMGKTVEVEVVRTFQSDAGKMIFAELVGDKKSPQKAPSKSNKQKMHKHSSHKSSNS